MTIGLILLAIVAILIFFGISERFFRVLGIKNWLAFLFVLALVVGAAVPSFAIGTLVLNWGGFVIPLIIMAVFMVIMRSGKQLLRSFLAILAVAAVAITTRMLIEPSRGALILATSLITGFLGGAIAYLLGQSRLAALSAALGGIVLGDIITNFLYVYAIGGYTFSLGSYGVFDSMIIAAIFSIVLHEAIGAIKKTAERRGAGQMQKPVKQAAEVGEDQYFMGDFERQRTDFVSVDMDEDVNKEMDANMSGLNASDHMTNEDSDGFFDDYI